MSFAFKPFETLPDVVLIEPLVHQDERGWFAETFKESEFRMHGIAANFVQDNQSRSTTKGILRGLHFQRQPAAQGKLVRCVIGEIFDVAVDIRWGSSTYAKWVSAILSADNHTLMWIPPGFAHGMLTRTEITEVAYKVTAEYSRVHDRSIRWDDPAIEIRWPVDHPILSKKDAEAPLLKDVDNNFMLKDEKATNAS